MTRIFWVLLIFISNSAISDDFKKYKLEVVLDHICYDFNKNNVWFNTVLTDIKDKTKYHMSFLCEKDKTKPCVADFIKFTDSKMDLRYKWGYRSGVFKSFLNLKGKRIFVLETMFGEEDLVFTYDGKKIELNFEKASVLWKKEAGTLISDEIKCSR